MNNLTTLMFLSRMTRSKQFYGYIRPRAIILCFMYVFVICRHKIHQEIQMPMNSSIISYARYTDIVRTQCLEFLIDANSCILNGRNCIKNNYTCIKPQGMLVVDYSIIPHEDLNKYAELTVFTVSDLITDINGEAEFAAASIPDQSVLSWKVDVGSYARTSGYNGIKATYIYRLREANFG